MHRCGPTQVPKHWILSYLAISWIFFRAAVVVLLRFMRYGGMRRSWRSQDSGAFWFWGIVLFSIAGLLGFFAMHALPPRVDN